MSFTEQYHRDSTIPNQVRTPLMAFRMVCFESGALVNFLKRSTDHSSRVTINRNCCPTLYWPPSYHVLDCFWKIRPLGLHEPLLDQSGTAELVFLGP